MDKNPSLHNRLTLLADGKDYFGFRDTYLARRQQLDPKGRLYWEAIYENLFGSEYRSLRAAAKFLNRYGYHDEDSGEMLYVSAIDRLRRFRYRAAAVTFRKLIRLHGHTMNPEEKYEALNNLAVCNALKNVPPQTVSCNGVRDIPVTKTSLGHLTARIECGGDTGNFIVDTGANFSAVSKTAAARMGLVPASSGIEVGTATGIRIECGLAYAPVFHMGSITVRNAIFIVIEDAQLDFSAIGYSIEGIIGLPVLRQMGELKFTRNRIRIGNLRIPRSVNSNLCFEGLMPLVQVCSNGHNLTFTLDTGANQTEYSYGYYSRNGEEIDMRATKLRGLRGGGGGVVRQKALTVTDEKLTIAGRTLKVPSMTVILDDYEFRRGKDGNLGLDALMSTGGFSLSFRRMTLYPNAGRERKHIKKRERLP